MSAAFFVVETKTNVLFFFLQRQRYSHATINSLGALILCYHFLAFRICSQKGGTKKRILTNLKCGMKTLRMSR